jgi:hypothetical protein
VPTEWITEVRNYRTINNNWWQQARDYAAAEAAMQNFLPQHHSQRFTVGASRIHNTTGMSVNYAYMLDRENRSAFTVSVGRAGSETAVRGSFGFEFGGDRRMKIDMAHLAPEPAAAPAPYEPPAGQALVDEDEYQALLVAQESAEQANDWHEQAEYRYAQQQSLIEELERDHDLKEEELAQLKREAAALRAKEEADEERRAKVRQLLKDKGDGSKGDSQ